MNYFKLVRNKVKKQGFFFSVVKNILFGFYFHDPELPERLGE
jgi:hypothetical protein